MIFKIAFFIIHCAWFCSDGFVVATKPRKEKNGNVDLERLNLRRLVDLRVMRVKERMMMTWSGNSCGFK
jgi:hypothetical protein